MGIEKRFCDLRLCFENCVFRDEFKKNSIDYFIKSLILLFMIECIYLFSDSSPAIILLIVSFLALILIGCEDDCILKRDLDDDITSILTEQSNYVWIIDFKYGLVKIFYRQTNCLADSQLSYVYTIEDLFLLVDSNDKVNVVELISNLKSEQRKFETSIHIKDYDELYKKFRIKANIRRTEQNEIEYMYGYADLLDNGYKEMMLESDKKINDVVSRVGDSYVMIEINEDGSLGECIVSNNEFAMLIGADENLISGKSLFELGVPDRVINQIQTSNKKEHITSFIGKNGNVKHILIKRNDICIKDKQIAMLLVKNITQLRKLQCDMKKNEELYRMFFEALPDAIFATEEGVIKYVNMAGVNLLNMKDRKQALNKKLLSFIDGKYHDKLISLKKERKNKYTEAIVNCADGSSKFVEIAYSAVMTGIDRAEKIVILRDVTKYLNAQKKLKETVKKNEELVNQTIQDYKLKEELFSNLSHDFKTPLNIILGVVQLFKKFNQNKGVRCDDKKVGKYLSVMNQNCFRLLRLINNLTDLVKSDTGYLQMNSSEVDVVEMLENLVTSVVDFVETKGIKMIFDTNVESEIVVIDIDKIERTILNLLSNSIKNCKKGDIISVTLNCENSNMRISVKDTGSGIPKDKLEHIFDRFVRGNVTSLNSVQGSGIGLTLVKSFIEMHNGTINVDSEVGVGTNVVIDIPYVHKEVFDYDFAGLSTEECNRVAERINHELSDMYL